jgi:hypothetical protein
MRKNKHPQIAPSIWLLPEEFDNIEGALQCAFEAGYNRAKNEMQWEKASLEHELKMAKEARQSVEQKTELDSLKTLGQLGQTFSSLAESLARGMQSRRNQL